MCSPWSKWVIQHKRTLRMKQDHNTYYMRCWLRLLWCSQSCCHTLNLSLWCILKALIITIPLFQLSCPYKFRPIPLVLLPHKLQPSFCSDLWWLVLNYWLQWRMVHVVVLFGTSWSDICSSMFLYYTCYPPMLLPLLSRSQNLVLLLNKVIDSIVVVRKSLFEWMT